VEIFSFFSSALIFLLLFASRQKVKCVLKKMNEKFLNNDLGRLIDLQDE
jgi:hypothetical protein